MKVFNQRKSIIIAVFIFLLFFTIFIPDIIKRIPFQVTVKSFTEEWLSSKLGRQMAYENMTLSIFPEPSFNFMKIHIKDRDGMGEFITANALKLKLSWNALLQKREIFLTELFLDHPSIVVKRDQHGILNIEDFIKKDNSPSLTIEELYIKKGAIMFFDEKNKKEQIIIVPEKMNISISTKGDGKTYQFHVLSETDGKSFFSISGHLNIPNDKSSYKKFPFEIDIKARSIQSRTFWPYLKEYFPVNVMKATFDIRSRLKGTFLNFSSMGEITFRDFILDDDKLLKQAIAFHRLQLEYAFFLKKNTLQIKKFLIRDENNNSLEGSMTFSELHQRNPQVDTMLKTSTLDLNQLRQFSFFENILQNINDFFKGQIIDGRFQVVEGKFKGKVNQFMDPLKSNEENLFYLKIKFDEGRINYRIPMPELTYLQGDLEIVKDKIIFKEGSGRFGNSTFSLNGVIADYLSNNSDLKFAFKLNMIAEEKEMKWFSDRFIKPELAYKGFSKLIFHISGRPLHISGSLDLTETEYRLKDSFYKEMGKSNKITFYGDLGEDKLRIQDIHYKLGKIAMNASICYDFRNKNRFRIDADSNHFKMEDIKALLPLLRAYEPEGLVRISLHGDKIDYNNFVWEGNVNIAKGSLKLFPWMKKINHIKGSFNFRDDLLETNNLQGKVGEAFFFVKGKLKSFKNPLLDIYMKTQELHLHDFGLYHRKSASLKPKFVEVNFSIFNHKLIINSLQASINNSTFHLEGRISDLSRPNLELFVTSNQLNLTDVILLTGIKFKGYQEKKTVPFALKAKIKSESGFFNQVPYQKLNSLLSYKENHLKIKSITFQAYGGQVNGDVYLYFPYAKRREYDVSFRVKKISAGDFFRLVGFKKEIVSGILTMNGHITSKGITWDVFKKNLTGHVRLKAVNGTLNHLPISSRVFTILNLSKLLKFKLPDKADEKIPFNDLESELFFKNGVVFIDNLQTKSDIINISVIGPLNLLNEEIDLTIGVQPFKEIIDKIPLTDWMLAGEGDEFFIAYFTAKGNWNDPYVEVIQVRFIPKNVLELFLKTFDIID